MLGERRAQGPRQCPPVCADKDVRLRKSGFLHSAPLRTVRAAFTVQRDPTAHAARPLSGIARGGLKGRALAFAADGGEKILAQVRGGVTYTSHRIAN
jgi:hypothetical protein